MNDQQIRLLFETLGTEGVKALKDALEGVNTEGKKVEKTLDDTEKTTKQARQGFLDISRATQDFAQGGLGGILNNLEGLGRAIPALLKEPLALFGSIPSILTLAGVAVFVFKDQIIQAYYEMTGAAKPFQTSLEELEKKLKELKDKPYKLVIDVVQIEEAQQKIDALKKSLAEYEAQQRMQKVVEVESGKKIQEAIRESALGAGGVETKVTDFLKEIRMGAAEAPGGRIAVAREKLAQAEEAQAVAAQKMRTAKDLDEYAYALGISFGHQKRINAAKEEEAVATRQIADQVKMEYVEVLRRAREATGAEQAEAQKRLQVLLTGAGERGLAGEIGGLTPEMIQRTKELTAIGAGAEPAAKRELARAQAEEKMERQFDEEATRVYNKSIEDRKKAADKEEDERRKRADKLSAAADKESAAQFEASLKGSGIAEKAGAMLAQIQAQGGVFDPRFGRVQPMSAADQEAYVRRQVEQYLHRQIGVDQMGRRQFAGRGMGAEETGLTAQAIVARGQQQVTTGLAGMAGQQKTNTDKLLAVSTLLQSEVTRLQAQVAQQSQQVDGLVHKTRRSANTRLAR